MNVPLLLLVLLFSVVVHECAHGWAALRLGDPTARDLGRLTLNPLRHIDPLGTIVVPLVLALLPGGLIFGWAKPVPVDHRRLGQPRRDAALVAAAGPASNLMLAALCAIGLGLLVGSSGPLAAHGGGLSGDARFFLAQLLRYGILLNCLLALFNLIPIPPLDGSWVVLRWLRGAAAENYLRLRPFGFLVVILLLNSGLGGWFDRLLMLVVGHYTKLANLVMGLLS